ncbi:craniofacial development protein 2-like [Drosophila yakuba]|nr:craniofacial development protein 2-like [Drosophila yakuba]
MEKLHIAIAGISEIRWAGSGETTTLDSNLVLHSGNSDGRRYGVGIFVSKCIKKALVSWKPISDRIMTARFRCRARYIINITQCYAPTEDANDDTKDDFYTALAATLNKLRQGDINILMGDFNAKIGPNNTGLRSVMGQHGTGTRNDNGERLVELCQLFQMVIGGTIFPHKDVHKYSWTSPSGNTRNQIDHICISRKWRHSLLDVRNKRGASIDSDHELVIAEHLIKLNRNHSRNTGNSQHRRAPPLNLHLLSDSTLKTRMTSTLREQQIPLEDHPWEHTCRQLRTTACNNAEDRTGYLKNLGPD